MNIFSKIRLMFSSSIVTVPQQLQSPFSFQDTALATNETIFSAITMLSEAIASLPISLRLAHNKMQPDEHSVAWLFEYGMNPNMTTFSFMRSMEMLRNSTGAAYAIKEFDESGNVVALWPLKTGFVAPQIDRETRELYYRIHDDISGETVYLHNSMVIAVGHIGGADGKPVNPIDVLRNSLDYDKSVKEFSVNQMEQGLRARIAMRVNGQFNKRDLEEYDALIRPFMKAGIVYLDNGKELTELKGNAAIDPKVFEVENITIARVARVYGIPINKFLPEKTSYSSAEQSDLIYLRDKILPTARMYEQEFTAKLLSVQDRTKGEQVKISLNGFARADMAARGNFYQKGLRSGWFCPDDIRSLEDLPPLPDGKGQDFYISKDLIPIHLIGVEYGLRGGASSYD